MCSGSGNGDVVQDHLFGGDCPVDEMRERE